ncbi:methylated-DNA--[protein]-cysteine S-methyltransferase [Bacillus swezeyi]|uniref:Methylated-DNA--protein-cysteine methyltransferase n=1 Tax=Bacillus swezeyi TaxID=1925020 RepID=A0A5M8RWU9_9BACI|nr:methylated-DNA--[protein]-cysteine S-methyltransferase [Bacillus swezeyi]KAA6453127.1 methylated-DNA--[protein]-cysteine S-methyltransferase [Bacillus swezeyi]KAA6476255.1 methylated-DNA--[protein]-cysteine S-methyltransferase [Bacillus swezeyi]TYS38498.1 methylated-DNA--[protein]-cysteine S-methyltransferase [Bacillus swezeyi]
MSFYIEVTSPFGRAYIVEQNEHITHVLFSKEELEILKEKDSGLKPMETALLQDAKRQLEEYFRGERRAFKLPMHQEGTAFQQNVWEALLAIPYGESRSYLDIACAIGNPKAVRAIGQANKKNALPILIPCHRVIGKNNTLTGYAGNETDKKAVLLEIENIPYKGK